jgi:hypothetical protein
MKTSSNEETFSETYLKTWDNCTPIEGSQLMSGECTEKHESIPESETYRDCGENVTRILGCD